MSFEYREPWTRLHFWEILRPNRSYAWLVRSETKNYDGVCVFACGMHSSLLTLPWATYIAICHILRERDRRYIIWTMHPPFYIPLHIPWAGSFAGTYIYKHSSARNLSEVWRPSHVRTSYESQSWCQSGDFSGSEVCQMPLLHTLTHICGRGKHTHIHTYT